MGQCCNLGSCQAPSLAQIGYAGVTAIRMVLMSFMLTPCAMRCRMRHASGISRVKAQFMPLTAVPGSRQSEPLKLLWAEQNSFRHRCRQKSEWFQQQQQQRSILGRGLGKAIGKVISSTPTSTTREKDSDCKEHKAIYELLFAGVKICPETNTEMVWFPSISERMNSVFAASSKEKACQRFQTLMVDMADLMKQ